MAINNGEDANSNTEVDNVVSIGVEFKKVFSNGDENQKICAESLKRGNYVIKFPHLQLFSGEALWKWKQAVTDKPISPHKSDGILRKC